MATPTRFSEVRDRQHFFGDGHVRFLRLPADICSEVGDEVNALQVGGGSGFATLHRFQESDSVRAINTT